MVSTMLLKVNTETIKLHWARNGPTVPDLAQVALITTFSQSLGTKEIGVC